MPARVVDSAIYLSDKIRGLKEEYRAEYSYLLPMAEANGVFEADPDKIWAVAYSFHRKNITPEIVQDILADMTRVGLLEVKAGVGKWLPLDSAKDVVKKRFLEEQGDRCALCKTDKPHAKGWHLDHNHITGRIRGVLCGNCNRGLGLLQDDPELLLKAREYLLAEFKEKYGPLWPKQG
jgi:hypothetical protein